MTQAASCVRPGFLVRYLPVARSLPSITGSDPALVCLVLAVAALGHALQIANGFYNPAALAWLTGAFALLLVAAWLVREPAAVSPAGRALLLGMMVAAIGWQLFTLLTSIPGIYIVGGANMSLFRAGVIAQTAVLIAGVTGIGALRRYWFRHRARVCDRRLMVPHPTISTCHRSSISARCAWTQPYGRSRISTGRTPAFTTEAVVGGRGGVRLPPAVELRWRRRGWRLSLRELAALVVGASLWLRAGLTEGRRARCDA